MADVAERLDNTAEIQSVLRRATDTYALGALEEFEPIEVGFEDYNVKIKTQLGQYVIKIFSKTREDNEVARNAAILNALRETDIHHPGLHTTSEDSVLWRDSSGLQMVAMDYIDGATFYSLDTTPSEQQLLKIAAEAVKINKLPIRPEYIFDKWAIPNVHWMYEQIAEYIDEEHRKPLVAVLAKYDAIDIHQLPVCFVHGDIIKTNVIVDTNDEVFVIDFSVANVYPRLQEVAVIAANLLADGSTPLEDRVRKATVAYECAGGRLTEYEKAQLYDYALVGVAMEYMGSLYEQYYNGESGDEVEYWRRLASAGLKDALGEE